MSKLEQASAPEPARRHAKLLRLYPAAHEQERGAATTGVAPAPRPAAGTRRLITVLFTDIVDSTSIALAMGDARWLDLHERHEKLVRDESSKVGGRCQNATGDGFVVTFASSLAAAAAADRIIAGSRELGLEIRTALHTGDCEVRNGRAAGIVFHIGARIVALAQPGEILVSRTVRDASAGSNLIFTPRGSRRLKGIPERWELYRLNAVPGRSDERHMQL